MKQIIMKKIFGIKQIISLKELLKLQFIYCLLGLLFNTISWILIENSYQSLTPTIPVQGVIAMAIYGVFLLTGYFAKIRPYRFLMLFAMIIFGYGGIIRHFFIMYQSPELYSSFFSGLTGVAINLFGLVLNILAAFGKFNVE